MSIANPFSMLIQSIRKKIAAKIRHLQRDFHQKKTIFPHSYTSSTAAAPIERTEAPVSQPNASGRAGATNVHKSFYAHYIGLFFFSFVVFFSR